MEAMKKLKGHFPIAFTTFKENGDIDYDMFRKQMDYLFSTGVHGIIMYGMTSEYHKIKESEKEILSQVFLDCFKGHYCASVLNVTDWCTDHAVETAKKYEAMGADMLMLMPPFYFVPSLDEIRRHIRAVLSAVKIPVLVQYAPLATKMFMPEQEIVDLSNEFPNAAFKIEYRPAVDFMRPFFELKPDLPVMTGWAGLDIIDLYKLGVRGVVTVGGLVEIYVAIFNALDAGNFEEAQRIYDKLHKYISNWMINPESLLSIEKEILVRRGIFENSYRRRPTYFITEENSREIDEFLVEFAEYYK